MVHYKKIQRSLKITLAVSAGLLAMASLSQAIQLADGTTYFAQPPRLVDATITQKAANTWGARYYFTLTLPEGAGEGLQKVAIAQQQGAASPRFELTQTEAFEGTRNRPGAKLSLKKVTVDAKTGAIEVIFEPSVSPGKTVTIGLYVTRNPNLGGVYLYGVTAFPVGEKPHGQFLGFGRIQIYEDNDANSVLPRGTSLI